MPQRTSLVVMPDFLKRAAELDKAVKTKLVRILWLLSEDFRHPSLQCKKVQGARHQVFECRVDQGVRLIYDTVHGMLRCWFVGEHDMALRFAVNLSPPAETVEVDDIAIAPVEEAAETSASEATLGVPPEGMILPLSKVETLLGCGV
jgi:mRNA-degrading endonuclease YafQ of YafQ-DinJ toxin-antitoxin module